MEERSRGGDLRLSHDALIKSSSDVTPSLLASASQPLQQQLVPPMMLPSLDAYLDAYRSLMSHDVQAMSASLGGAGCGAALGMIRPPGGLTLPVLPTAAAAAAAAASLVSSPYYGLSPYSAGVDLARYGGLLSPVYVPPFIAPLLCGAGGGGAAAPCLLPPSAAEPLQASPAASSRPSSDTAVYPQSQSFSVSLLEACAAAARKNDSSMTPVVGRAGKQQDAKSKPVRHADPHPVDRAAKPVPPRTVASATGPPTSDRKWNSSSGKVDRGADVAAGQSSMAVDFSTRLTSDGGAGAKSSVSGSTMSADSWKISSAAAAALLAAKNATDNSTHTYGKRLIIRVYMYAGFPRGGSPSLYHFTLFILPFPLCLITGSPTLSTVT